MQKFTFELTESELSGLRLSLMYAAGYLDQKIAQYDRATFPAMRGKYEADLAAVEVLFTAFEEPKSCATCS